MFVVTFEAPGSKKQFISLDKNSGGYPYWSSILSHAHAFPSIKDANEFINSELTPSSNCTMSDGERIAPGLIRGLDAYRNDRVSEGMMIKIEIITPTPMKEFILRKLSSPELFSLTEKP